MTYSAGQVVEVCSERSRGWTPGFNYGSKITLTRLIPDNEACAGEWDALSMNRNKGIISEDDFRPVPEHSPVRTETVTTRHIEPGVYGRLQVVGPAVGGRVHVLFDAIGTSRGLDASELRDLARVATELAEFLDAQ